MKKNLILITLCIIISCGSGSSSDQAKSAVSEKQSHANDVIANKKIPKTNVATKSVIEKNISIQRVNNPRNLKILFPWKR